MEIGVWHGVTTRRLRAVMSPAGSLYAIDPYPVGRLGISFQKRIAYGEVGSVDNGNLQWIRETGGAASRSLGPKIADLIDFMFIDGDHSFKGLQEDWEGWSPLVVSGGIVALHDSRPTPTRPIQQAGSVLYTNAVIRRDPRFTVIDEIDSLTVLRRNEK